MLKNLTRLEHKIGDRIYHLICDPTSPLEEVKEACMKFIGYAEYIQKMAKNVQKDETSTENEHMEEKPPENQHIEEKITENIE